MKRFAIALFVFVIFTLIAHVAYATEPRYRLVVTSNAYSTEGFDHPIERIEVWQTQPYEHLMLYYRYDSDFDKPTNTRTIPTWNKGFLSVTGAKNLVDKWPINKTTGQRVPITLTRILSIGGMNPSCLTEWFPDCVDCECKPKYETIILTVVVDSETKESN